MEQETSQTNGLTNIARLKADERINENYYKWAQYRFLR